ncbi:MAG: hypothetical protein R2744_10615 [Bacteroidales bacterium]
MSLKGSMQASSLHGAILKNQDGLYSLLDNVVIAIILLFIAIRRGT